MKNSFRAGLVLFLASFVSHSAVTQAALPSGTYTIESAASQVTFLTIGRPSLIKIKGVGASVTGGCKIVDQATSQEMTGEAEFDLSSLKTGIKLRDSHMKDKYLEVAKFPKALLKLSAISLAPSQKQGQFKGMLTLHGVTLPIEGSYEILKAETEASEVKLDFKLLLSDYGISIPSFAGITVANDVEITANTSLKRSSAAL